MAFVRLHDPVRGTQRELSLRKPLVSIGRAAGNDVQIDDATVEATHVNLIRRGNRYTLSIAQRGAEVYVNGRLKRKADLEYGDRILVGRIEMTLLEGEPDLGVGFLRRDDVGQPLARDQVLDDQHRHPGTREVRRVLCRRANYADLCGAGAGQRDC